MQEAERHPRCQSSHMVGLLGGRFCDRRASVYEPRVKPGVGYIPMCVNARINFFKESPLMLSCASCVIEEVCHCFPSGGNLANVRRRSKMAAMVNYTG